METVRYKFSVIDKDALQRAVVDLEECAVYTGREPGESLDAMDAVLLVLGHLDMLADFRGKPGLSWVDCGFERVS